MADALSGAAAPSQPAVLAGLFFLPPVDLSTSELHQLAACAEQLCGLLDFSNQVLRDGEQTSPQMRERAVHLLGHAEQLAHALLAVLQAAGADAKLGGAA